MIHFSKIDWKFLRCVLARTPRAPHAAAGHDISPIPPKKPPYQKSPPLFFEIWKQGGGFFGIRPKAEIFWGILHGFTVENTSETLPKHGFCTGKPCLGGFRFKFFAPASPTMIDSLKNRYLVWSTPLTVIWYGTVCVSNDLYALLLVKSAAGAKFSVLFAGFRS